MRHIGRDSEAPGKSWGFVILRLPSDFASLNSEFVNHSQGKMMRAGVGVFHETDQRIFARRVIRGEGATTTGFYRLEPATALEHPLALSGQGEFRHSGRQELRSNEMIIRRRICDFIDHWCGFVIVTTAG